MGVLVLFTTWGGGGERERVLASGSFVILSSIFQISFGMINIAEVNVLGNFVDGGFLVCVFYHFLFIFYKRALPSKIKRNHGPGPAVRPRILAGPLPWFLDARRHWLPVTAANQSGLFLLDPVPWEGFVDVPVLFLSNLFREGGQTYGCRTSLKRPPFHSKGLHCEL